MEDKCYEKRRAEALVPVKSEKSENIFNLLNSLEKCWGRPVIGAESRPALKVSFSPCRPLAAISNSDNRPVLGLEG